MADPVVKVGVQPEIDPGAAAAVGEQAGRLVGGGIVTGVESMTKGLEASVARDLAADLNRAGKEGTTALKGLDRISESLFSSLSDVAKALARVVQSQQDLGSGQGAITQAVKAQGDAIRRTSIDATAALQSSAKERTAIIEREGSLASIAAQTAGQKQVIAARTAGQQRVAITRGIVDTIGRLEKGLGATLSGIARTTVSAISKTFSGIGSGLSSVFRRADKDVAETNSVLRSSLKERETLIRSSFSRQEREVRSSMTRQEKAVQGLRAGSQAGLVGAANRNGLFAGIGATLGLGVLARNTFTIGADFTRGLAVLQASLGLTADEMKKVRQASLDLGNDIALPGVSALDASQAIGLLAKQFAALGPAASQAALDAAKGTLQLSRAAGVGAEQAAQVVGAAVNVFGIAADQATAVADQVAGALKNAAGVSFDDFAAAFKQGSSVFAQFVVPAEGATDALTDFNTALALMARQGLVGSDAGTSLKNFFLQANRGTEDANSALAEISERAGVAGTAFFDAKGNSRAFSDTLDILRRGLTGLTDEQRNSTLQTIFGSDAQRVANALLSVSAEEYEKTRKAVQEEGLAAKLAAAQNAGFAGALDALKSVIETIQIQVYQFLEPALKTAALAVATFVSALAFGGGDTLRIIRQGLLGIAAGLAAILVFKGAVEVISLLGKALALAATPFGAIVLAAGLIGGILGVMSAQGLSLTEVFDNVKNKLIEFGTVALDFLQPKLERLRDFFTGTIVPAVQSFAATVGEALVNAFHASVDFIQGTVIPGFQRLVNFIVSVVAPALITAGRTVRDFVLGVGSALVDLGRTIQPVVQPLLSGFADLGRAIGAAFTGDFGSLGAGLAAAGSGIASTATTIGRNIVTALTPIAKQVGDFFKNLFTLDNLGSVVDGVATVLNIVAEKLAAIISHPKFLAGVGIAAAALVVVGAKWALAIITGLGEGLASNIPQLLNNIGKFFIDNFAAVITGLVAAATLGPALISGFRSVFGAAGTASAGEFLKGFKLKAAGAKDFISSLFGGNESASSTASKRFWNGIGKDIQGVQNQLRVLGSTTIVDPANMSAAKEELANLKRGFTDAQIAGLTFRDKLAQLSTLGATIKTGLGNSLGGVKDIFVGMFSQFGNGSTLADIRAGGSRIKGGFTSIFDGLRTYAESQGTTVGKLAAAAIGKALVGGLAAVTAGVTFGQSLGNGGGLMSLLGLGGSAVGIGAALGGGPIGIAAGVATVGIGLLTAAMTSSSSAAKKYREDVNKIATALSPGLAEAAKAGQISIEQLRDGLNFSDLGGTDAFGDVVESIVKSLGDKTLTTLRSFNVEYSKAFSDILKSGGSSEDIQKQFLALVTGTSQFTQAFGKDAQFAREQLEQIASGTVPDVIPTDVFNRIQALPPVFQDIALALGGLDSAYGKNADALTKAGDLQFALGVGAEETTTKFSNMAGEAARLGRAVTEIPSSIGPTIANDAAIGAVTGGLAAIIAQKERINELFAPGVLPDGLSAFDNSLQLAAIAVEGIGKNLDTIKTEGGFDFLTGAKLGQAMQGFGDELRKAFGAGFESGDIIDEATARAKLQPIFDAAAAGASDETRAELQAQFDSIVAHIAVEIDFKQADLGVAALTGGMAGFASPVTIPTEVAPIDVASAIAVGQAQANNSPISIPVASPTIPTDFLPAFGLARAGEAAGANLGQGLVNGINSKTGAVRAASANLAAIADNALRLRAGIQSPSKVFHRLGEFLTQGFADGIEAGGSDVASTVSKLVDDAIAAATGQIDEASKALRDGSSKLFDAFFGSGNAAGGTRIGDVSAGVTQAFHSLASTLDSSFDQAADILKRSATEALSRADLDILGENAGSLNPGDVLGANNRSAVISALSSIVDVGKEMIDQGATADVVAGSLTRYVDQFRLLAAQYGLNAEEVEALVGQMGLSSDTIGEFTKALSTLEAGLGHVKSSAEALNDIFVDLFNNATTGKSPFKTPQGVLTAEQAFGAVQIAFQGVRSQLDSAFSSIKDANEAGPNATLAQKALQGQNALSLDFNSLIGAQNRGSFISALGDIQKLGEALLKGGSSSEYVRAEMLKQVDALVELGTSLGFNGDQIRALAAGLGLSAEALDEFLKSVDAAKDINKKKEDATNPATPTLPGAPGSQSGDPNAAFLPRDLIVNLAVPYGDPEAIALAVGNKVATQIRIIGG